MVAISNGRGIAIVDYELEVVAAEVLRRRLRVRLRFGLLSSLLVAVVASLSAAALAAVFDVPESLAAAAFAASLLFWPWSICSSPTAPLSSLTEGCLAIG